MKKRSMINNKNHTRGADCCRDCWQQLPPDLDKVRCDECRKKGGEAVKRTRLRRQAIGVCVTCGSNEIITHGKNRECYVCYMRTIALKNLGSRTRWQELRELWERQAGICPYTGETLILGVNASIDHILPRSRYPERKHDITNVEWVSLRVNVMKRDFTKEEFLAFLGRIHEYSNINTTGG